MYMDILILLTSPGTDENLIRNYPRLYDDKEIEKNIIKKNDTSRRIKGIKHTIMEYTRTRRR